MVRHVPAYVQRTVIVGAGDVGQRIARKILQHPEYGIELLGFIDDQPKEQERGLEEITILGGVEDILDVVRTQRVERVIVAFSNDHHDVTLRLLRALGELHVRVDVVPRFFELMASRVRMHSVEGLPLASLPRLALSRSAQWVKRAVDITFSTVLLLLLLPLGAVIALAITRDSAGPVFFRQTRVGAHGKEFRIFKFRTMRTDAEETKHQIAGLNKHASPGGDPRMFKVADDPRATAVGAFLRRYSIDEVPQLLNVVRGEMSLVGPRPLIPEEDQHVTDWRRRRLQVRPGMTGLWQVLGRDDIPFEEMAALDYTYVTTWSLFGDLKILVRTVPAVIRPRSHAATATRTFSSVQHDPGRPRARFAFLRRMLTSDTSKRAISISLAASVAIQGINAITGVALAHAMPPTERGELAGILVFAGTIATLAVIGVPDAVTYFTAKNRERTVDVAKAAARLLVAAIALALLVATVVLILAPPNAIRGAAPWDWIYLLFIPLSMATLLLQSILFGLKRFPSANAVRVSVIAAAGVGIIALALANRLSVGAAVAVYIAANVLSLGAALILSRRSLSMRPTEATGSVSSRPLLGFGLKSHAANAGSVLNERGDQFVIAIVLSAHALGLYAVSVTLASVSSLIASTVSMVALPIVASEQNPKLRAALAHKLVFGTAILALCCVIPLFVLMGTLVRHLFSPAYEGAVTPARILLVAGVVLAVSKTSGSLLKATGAPQRAAMSEGIALVVAAVSLAALLPTAGITGAAIASVVTYATSCTISTTLAFRRLRTE